MISSQAVLIVSLIAAFIIGVYFIMQDNYRVVLDLKSSKYKTQRLGNISCDWNEFVCLGHTEFDTFDKASGALSQQLTKAKTKKAQYVVSRRVNMDMFGNMLER